MTARSLPPPVDKRARRQRWRLSLYLARRHLKQRRSRLLSAAAWAGLGSVALGVTAMSVSMALMSGYTDTLLEKMFLGGAIIVVPIGSPADEASVPARLLEHPDVREVAQSLLVAGSLQSRGGAANRTVDVHVRGVEPGTHGPLGAGGGVIGLGSPAGASQVRLGVELAQRLGVGEGDLVRLVALDMSRGARFRYRTLEVVDLFETGFSLFDRQYAVMDLEELQRLTGGLPFYEVSTSDPQRLDRLAKGLERLLGDEYLVRDWRQSSPGLFTALRLQKWALFLLLGLIVVVSTFNVAAALLVMVRERTREVGVLLSLGTPAAVLRSSFFLSGLALGVLGAVAGGALAAALAWVVSTFELLRFAPGVGEIYFVDHIPLRVRWRDSMAVATFTFVVVGVGCWWPLRDLRALRPADALRVE